MDFFSTKTLDKDTNFSYAVVPEIYNIRPHKRVFKDVYTKEACDFFVFNKKKKQNLRHTIKLKSTLSLWKHEMLKYLLS